MTKDEALKLALEALETPWNAPYVDGCDLALGKKMKAITAIKEALAQPEQPKVRTGNCLRVGVCASEGHKIAPQRKPLTGEEIIDYFQTNMDTGSLLSFADGVRYAEAAHGIKEKNT